MLDLASMSFDELCEYSDQLYEGYLEGEDNLTELHLVSMELKRRAQNQTEG